MKHTKSPVMNSLKDIMAGGGEMDGGTVNTNHQWNGNEDIVKGMHGKHT